MPLMPNFRLRQFYVSCQLLLSLSLIIALRDTFGYTYDFGILSSKRPPEPIVRLNVQHTGSGDKEWIPPFNNPPFFPCSLPDLARDAAFSVEVALISRLKRIRVDIRSQFMTNNVPQLQWVILLAGLLCGGQVENSEPSDECSFRMVHVFIDKKYRKDEIEKALESVKSMNSVEVKKHTTEGNESIPSLHVAISQIKAGLVTMSFLEHEQHHHFFEAASKMKAARFRRRQIHGKHHPRDFLCILFCPDNVRLHSISIDSGVSIRNSSDENRALDECSSVIEDVQSLCFEAAICGVPVLMVNPALLSATVKSYGYDRPLLLNDFSQVYYVTDKYYQFSGEIGQSPKSVGLVLRAASGLDMFLLDEIYSSLSAGGQQDENHQGAFSRLYSWPSGVANDIDVVLAEILNNLI